MSDSEEQVNRILYEFMYLHTLAPILTVDAAVVPASSGSASRDGLSVQKTN